jgi:hypothetical protein
MPDPDTHPVQVDYAVDPPKMSQAIEWYLTPVVDTLADNSRSYSAAHDEVAAAHASEAPGWFGGDGNGRVRMATSSFLNALEWQLRQLVEDQTELATSVYEYRAMLQAHLEWATTTDQNIADRFNTIGNDLDKFEGTK